MANAYTISATNGDHSESHSRRDYTPRSADKVLAKDNDVIYDCGNDRQHFNEFFRDAIEEYNGRQKRTDRKKSLDYLSALENGTEGYGKSEKTKEKPFYHDVIQIGNRDTNGVTDRGFDVDYWRKLKDDGKTEEASAYVKAHLNHSEERKKLAKILREVAIEIRDNVKGKYSNICVHRLIMHRDEPNGTDHLDFVYTIFTDGETRGPAKRVSMNKGLAAMGYHTTETETALMQFREDIKNRIEEKMAEQGYQREVKGEHRKHQPTAVYELEQRAKSAEKRLAAAQAGLATIESRESEVAIREEEDAYFRKSYHTKQEQQNKRQAQLDERETVLQSRENAFEEERERWYADAQRVLDTQIKRVQNMASDIDVPARVKELPLARRALCRNVIKGKEVYLYPEQTKSELWRGYKPVKGDDGKYIFESQRTVGQAIDDAKSSAERRKRDVAKMRNFDVPSVRKGYEGYEY